MNLEEIFSAGFYDAFDKTASEDEEVEEKDEERREKKEEKKEKKEEKKEEKEEREEKQASIEASFFFGLLDEIQELEKEAGMWRDPLASARRAKRMQEIGKKVKGVASERAAGMRASRLGGLVSEDPTRKAKAEAAAREARGRKPLFEGLKGKGSWEERRQAARQRTRTMRERIKKTMGKETGPSEAPGGLWGRAAGAAKKWMANLGKETPDGGGAGGAVAGAAKAVKEQGPGFVQKIRDFLKDVGKED